MLGWYGLHDTSSNNSIMYDRDLSPKHVEGDTGSPPYPASTPVDDDHLHHKDRHLQEDNEISCESAQPIMIVPCTKDRDIEEARLMMMPCGNSEVKESSVTRLDGQSIHAIPPPPMPFEGMPSQPQNGNNQDKKMGGRKLIGMRYLFPPPSDGLSLLEKARVWVARHDYKYFVGWSDEQLSRVDPALKPICAITPDLYKMHMNRSEYCRNVKLKYCLESDTDWAQEFREKLAKPYNKGGFSGLCQAKIVAAELWRKHSENYKSHQARYPNPKSKYRARRISSNPSDQATNPNENMFPLPSTEFFKYNQDVNVIYQRSDVMKASEPASVMRFMRNSFGGGNGSQDSFPGSTTSAETTNDGITEAREETTQTYDEANMMGAVTANNSEVVIKQEFIPPSPLPNPALKPDYDESLVQRTVYPFEPFKCRPELLPPPVRDSYVNPPGQYYGASSTGADSTNAVSQIKKNISGRNNDYRKSERGLSYLFPSLIDQQLSLLDKVRITVLRHKNNYFLGWSEEQLKRVDPLVRPKMPVTRELYKEYCHRNAMKYDSNLQFAMESQTSWAVEFRDRLVKPPNEGGFHSLCEVKQEAGRLWKEFSGRYKMHNVVKAQMDMNNEQSKTPAVYVERSELVCSSTLDDTSDFRSTASSPGPRLDRITSPIRKFISRSANSSPTLVCEEPILRYATADFPIEMHNSRKRKQSDDSGCASLPSPTNGTVDPDIYKHNFAHKPTPITTIPADGHMFGVTPIRTNFALHESMPRDNYMYAKIPRLQRSSSGMASEVTNSMLFAPLPPELSVVNQLFIWLQRHRNNYFIGWSQVQIDKLNPFLRPLYVVTPDVLKSHVSPTMFAMFDKVEEVITSQSVWAKGYQEKLGLPPEQGGFRTIEEALTDAMDIWMTHSQPKVSPPREKDVQNPGLLRLKDMFRAKTNMRGHNVVGKNMLQHIDPNNTLEGLLHSTQVSTVSDTDPGNSLVMAHPTETPRTDETALDLSNKNSSVTNSDDVAIEAKRNSTANVLANLWNCRKQLQELCRDSVASSWQDRLQPHLQLLHEKLGENYQLPASVSDCMVDLMLVLLHESLIQT